jgi:hypothetical protein
MAAVAEVRRQIRGRCDTIEETYELLLAYAAQGLRDDRGSSSGGQVREFLTRTDAALADLAERFTDLVDAGAVTPEAPYRAFIEVLARDARSARAAVQLVLAQPAISSQIVDNLNASIHLRALLTDIFLIDEVLPAESTAS